VTVSPCVPLWCKSNDAFLEGASHPYLVSGGWWRAEVHREYAFAQTLRGDILWVFYDRRRRRWHQGRVG